MKQWTARVAETFERCKRRASVDFPSAARGWLTLNCAGLSEEQKAIVKAKTQGSLEFQAVSQALRSCFPVYKAAGNKKKTTGVYQADPLESSFLEVSQESADFQNEFADVETFLSDHTQSTEVENETISEAEAAEVLAVTWKERRKEIAKYQQSRQFGAANQSRRSFRVEVEELKRRTKCRRCGKTGHWARECRSTMDAQGQKIQASNTSSRKSQDTAFSSKDASVHYVEEDRLMAQSEEADEEPSFVGSIEPCPQPREERVPVQVSENVVLAAGLVSSPGFGVVDSGCGRTLIGENTLKDFVSQLQQIGRGAIKFYETGNVFKFGNGATEVSKKAAKIPVGIRGRFGLIDAAIIAGGAPLLLGRPTLEKLQVKLDFAKNEIDVFGSSSPMKLTSAGQLLIDLTDFPSKDKPSCSTVEEERPEESPRQGKVETKTKVTLKDKECRCLLTQAKKHAVWDKSGTLVAELFSPPRFSAEARRRGCQGVSYDIKDGCDLLDPQTQTHVDKELDRLKPRLLVCCPPCTHRGGWEHLNRKRRSMVETALLLKRSRKQVQFCERQMEKQLARGGDILFEHPFGSEVWDQEAGIVKLVQRFGKRRIDMCAFGLKCPDTELPIQKATGLVFSKQIGWDKAVCPGCPKHRPVEGKLQSGENVSSFVASYPQKFVQVLLESALKETGCAAVDVGICWAFHPELKCLVSSVEQPEEDVSHETSADNSKVVAVIRTIVTW